MSLLFSPLTLGSVTLRNRVIVSPMCQFCAEDGLVNDWHLVHLGSRAVGGAGLVIVEATSVTPEGRITPWDLGLWSDAQAKAFEPVTRFLTQQGAVPGLQLAHAGRKASMDRPWGAGEWIPPARGGWEPMGPSPEPFAPGYGTPHAMTTAQIDGVVDAFAAATRRALGAGFRVIEIHMAHGYLLHQFLSPLVNRRTDAYGGNFENRIRLPLRVVEAVREAWPEQLPLFLRISATDWVEGGWDLPQSVLLARAVKERGVDLVDCSSGGAVAGAQTPLAPGYQVPFAAAIRQEARIATGAVGLITEPEQAEGILARGEADAVLLGRELLRQPYWPLHAARALGVDIPWPVQYLRGKP